QMIGFLGNVTDIVVARPSPSLTISQAAPAPSGTSTCGKDKKVALDLTAQGTAFLETCLVAAPGKFAINFDNKDAGVLHNVDVFDKQGGKSLGATDPALGPKQETLDLDLQSGSYYFQCHIHPTQMFGTLAVVDAAK